MKPLAQSTKGSTASSISSQFFQVIIGVLLFAGILIVLAAFIGKMQDAKAPVPEELELTLATKRITNVCFAINESGIYQPNILNYTKLTQEQLSKCFSEPKGSILVSVESLESNTFNPFFSKIGGGATEQEKKTYVLVQQENKRYPAQLTVRT
ncbi:MAG: hypothetical protein ACQESC_01800 [Nanobdellota archaeon]